MRLSKSRTTIRLLAFAAALAASALSSAQGANRFIHANGLAVVALPGFLRTFTRDGYSFTQIANTRTPKSMSIVRSKVDPLSPNGLGRTGRTFYREEELGGGSGGTEYKLTVVRPGRGDFIVLVAYEQSEWGSSFREAWELIESAEVVR
jgi:hypothetical protein